MTQSQNYARTASTTCIWRARERKTKRMRIISLFYLCYHCDVALNATRRRRQWQRQQWLWLRHLANIHNTQRPYRVFISHLFLSFSFANFLFGKLFKRKQKQFSNPLFSTQTMHRSRSHALKKHFGCDGNFSVWYNKHTATLYTTKCEIYVMLTGSVFSLKMIFPIRFALHK